jgi:hypothetical protein
VLFFLAFLLNLCRHRSRCCIARRGGGAKKGGWHVATNSEGGADNTHKLTLIRHGESVWNKENLFTGRTAIDLSEKRGKEANGGSTTQPQETDLGKLNNDELVNTLGEAQKAEKVVENAKKQLVQEANRRGLKI